MTPPGVHDDLRAFVAAVAAGERAMTAADVRALLAAGHPREAILDALIAVADDPAASRRLHRALGVLRDATRG